mgnify:CR=1 FL=1
MKFILASHNKGKLAEMQKILGELGVEVVLQSDLGLDLEPEENGATFTENARIKAKAVMEASGLPAIADDSGLCVDALNGAPGVYSARYGGPGLDDTGRWQLLLKNMEGIENRACKFVSVICCFSISCLSVIAVLERDNCSVIFLVDKIFDLVRF